MSQARERQAPRYQGRITTWKDDEGFGFITPNGGGPTVFVHIKSFESRQTRPATDVIVTYHLGANAAGKPRAENVAFVGAPSVPPPASTKTMITLPVAFGFLGLLGLCVALGIVPARILYAYCLISAVAFVTYWLDKSAAQNNQWRTKETTLHLLGLAGGWPGALLAQRLLRHKSSKQSFQEDFRMTVIANCVALCALMTPPGMRTFGPVLGLL